MHLSFRDAFIKAELLSLKQQIHQHDCKMFCCEM